MTHPTEETLNDYVERELSPAEQVRVATHLETCADCALVVAEFQQVVREASALGPLDAAARTCGRRFRRSSLVDSRRVVSRQSSVDSPESTSPRVR